MSRVGEKPIAIPKEVKVEISKQVITASGAKGKQALNIPLPITAKVDKDRLILSRPNDTKSSKSLHGLARSLAFNLIAGVEKGFVKELEIVGVGFRAQVQGKVLNMQLGFSHPVNFPIPDDIKVQVGKQNKITIEGMDKARVGQIAAEIRHIFPPEPYKGKGIRYTDEKVRRKVGKVVSK
ncbi:MAG: 50S ribosomal protein L6 [Candidatus Omnitrophica bacterium]|nr:50S ribosomal protein L6 [Candidatus Omnitrophota bacterium]